MLKIGDFSRLAQVTVRTLRYYDQLDLLKPAHIDQFTNYRYYDLDQLPRLNRILALRDLGLTLEEIAPLLQSDVRSDTLRELLDQRRRQIEQELQQAQIQLMRVESRIQMIENESEVPGYDVILKSVEPVWGVTESHIVPQAEQMSRYCDMIFANLFVWVDQHGAAAPTPAFLLYHNVEFALTDLDVQGVVPIRAQARHKVAETAKAGHRVELIAGADQVASVIHTGTLLEMENAFRALLNWMGIVEVESTGPLREVHVFGRVTDLDKSLNPQVVVELQVPVKEQRLTR